MITAINEATETVLCCRGWPRSINIVQMEDTHNYGYQFRPVPTLSDRNAGNVSPAMMTWTLCSILSSVKELWQSVDSKPVPWRFSRWEGHILTYICQNLFQFESMRVDPKLPYARITSTTAAVKIVNRQALVVSKERWHC